MSLKTKCRMCKGKNLKTYLNLGFHPHSDGFLTKEQLNEKEIFYPLSVMICLDCGLHQLDYVVPKEDLYNQDYLYESSVSETGKRHYFSMAESICKELDIEKGSLVVDIGSNVGILLEGFKNAGMNVLGIDPAPKIVEIANKRGIETIEAFFDRETVKQVINSSGKASVVTGTNVFAHIDDLDELMCGIKELLTDNGVFIFEVPYLVEMIEHLEYDTIYHQHLSYISVKPLIPFFKKYRLEIFNIGMEYYIHGGSVRFFVGEEKKRDVSSIVGELLRLEEEKGMYSLKRLERFSDDVRQHRLNLISMLIDIKRQGKRIVGIGAAAKGNTLLNYCGIHLGILDYLTEKSTLKIGRYSPGMHLPVVPDEELMKDLPDYGLILPWNLSEEIMKRLNEFKEAGGRFIIPIPHPKIV